MEFAENFTCQTMDEMQFAYWNSSRGTCNPPRRSLQEEWWWEIEAVISEVTRHIIHFRNPQKLVLLSRLLKQYFPDVNTIYLHWQPIFPVQEPLYDVCKIFGIRVRWKYFESGHGRDQLQKNGGRPCKARQGNNPGCKGRFKCSQQDLKSIEYMFCTHEDYASPAEFIGKASKNPPKGHWLFMVCAQNGCCTKHILLLSKLLWWKLHVSFVQVRAHHICHRSYNSQTTIQSVTDVTQTTPTLAVGLWCTITRYTLFLQEHILRHTMIPRAIWEYAKLMKMIHRSLLVLWRNIIQTMDIKVHFH